MNFSDLIIDSSFMGGVIKEGTTATQETTQTQSTTEAPATPNTAVAAEPNPYGMVGTIVLWVGVMILMYFMMFRGPKKEQKRKAELRASLKVGDNIVTNAGFYGKIVDIGTDVFIIEFGSNRGIRVPVSKEAVEGVKDPVTTPMPKESVETK